MPVSRRLPVNRTAKIEAFDNAARRQVDFFGYELRQSRIGQYAGTECFDLNGNRFCYADRISNLNLAFSGKFCGNDILGHVTGGIRCAAVDFRRIFS